MSEPARFQRLTNGSHPKKAQLVLLLIKDGIETRGWTAYPEYQKLLDGEHLSGFHVEGNRTVGNRISVMDTRILGWCPIDNTPPE